MGLPDRWNVYTRKGRPIEGTPFIAFKVPLKDALTRHSNLTPNNSLSPRILMELIPNLGLVIDLTFTDRYYDPQEFLTNKIEHKKVKIEGHVIPKKENYEEFRNTVNDFLRKNENKDTLVGVHCTHGLNRTGYLICRYMIDEMKISPEDAINKFEEARGHKMERQNYLNDLRRDSRSNDRVSTDTRTSKISQTNPGIWIDNKQNRNVECPPNDFERRQTAFNLLSQIRPRDFIPDGKGGYLVHITPGQINVKLRSVQESTKRSRWDRNDRITDGQNRNMEFRGFDPKHEKRSRQHF